MRVRPVALLVALLLQGCVRDVSSDERLERATQFKPLNETAGAAELAKLSCSDIEAELAKARDVNRNETDRVMAYIELYDGLKKKRDTFHEAMAKNPDLAYREGSEQYIAARDVCVQQTADVEMEFGQYVRELVEVPTVQDIKGGNTVTVARLDFNTLRQAIASLAPEDREALVARVNTAEKKVQEAGEASQRRRK